MSRLDPARHHLGMDEPRPDSETRELGTAAGDFAPRVGDAAPDPLALVRDADFPIVLRGYAREEVDAFVAQVSALIAELDASRSPESAVRAALDRVGEETSGILQRARETADEITARSRAQADDRVQAAEREARSLRAEAEARAEELDADIEALWAERARLIEEVRRLSDELTAVAVAAVERMPPPGSAGESVVAAESDTEEGEVAVDVDTVAVEPDTEESPVGDVPGREPLDDQPRA